MADYYFPFVESDTPSTLPEKDRCIISLRLFSTSKMYTQIIQSSPLEHLPAPDHLETRTSIEFAVRFK